MHPETANWLQQVLISSNYSNRDRIYDEFDEVLSQYNGLNPKFDKHVFRGCFYNLLGMIGVIPVTYRNVTYNIPIGIWVMYDYPLTPPEFVVMPTENMKIVVGKHVKPDGVITHPYLDTYASRPQNRMIEFISILRKIFSTETPVVSVKQPVKSSQTSNSFSMPQPVSMSMPRPNTFMYNTPTTTTATTNNVSYNYSYPSTSQPSYSLGGSGSLANSSNSLNRSNNSKASVLNEVKDKIKKDIETINKDLKSQIDVLLDENKKLLENEMKISNSMNLFEGEMLKIKSNITIFQGKNKEIAVKIEQLKNKKEINPDDILQLTPLMNQLVDTIAEESAIEDMIYYLGKALTSEQIDLSYYLKHIRALSREQFLKKVLIKKIRVQAQIM